MKQVNKGPNLLLTTNAPFTTMVTYIVTKTNTNSNRNANSATIDVFGPLSQNIDRLIMQFFMNR